MKRFDIKHLWRSALSLMLALLLALSVCGAAFASGEASASSEEPAQEDDLAARADRQSLHLESVGNAWQLGGYVTEDGRTVRENVLLRTGTLANASEEDIRRLSEVYHLTTIVDFRSPMETTQAPDPEIPGAEYINISLEDKEKESSSPATLAEMASVEMQFSDEPGRAMIEMIRLGWRTPDEDMYITMITSNATDVGFRAFLDVLLAQDEDSVVLWHCRSGKDRTGAATMILLTLLGVDEETILRDFDLTNYFLADEINAEVEKSANYTDDEEELEMVRVNNGVSVDFMARAFDYAEEQCGSMLEYVKQQYHVTDEEIARLRELYLTDGSAAAASGEASGIPAEREITEDPTDGSAAASGEASAIPAEREITAEMIEEAEERSLHLEGVSNARQLGGIAAADGRRVRENVLLRTGELAGATEEDIRTLAGVYHVTTVVDLRNAAECEETPDPQIGGAKNVHVALRDESMAAALKAFMGSGEQTKEDQTRSFIERIRSGWNPLNEDIYVDLLKTDACASGLRAFFDLLLEQEEGTAILWHCSGGKDRTSVVAAAILTLLGVDKETILDEFELTNVLIADEVNAKVEESRQYTDDENELALVRATALATREYMERAFDYVESESGSMLAFLRERCQVTDEEIARLQELYLTD